MSGLLYADGYFPAAFCGLYQYDPELYNEFSGLTGPGYRHPSGLSLYHIYSSYLDNLTVEQAAKIYWRGRVIAAASTPHSEPTYSSSPGAPPLHLLPTSRTRWGSYDPAMRVCGDWGDQPIDTPIYADPEIPAGTWGPPSSSTDHYATPFAAQNMGITCDVRVFCYFDNNHIKYGVVFEGGISVQGVFWHWDWDEEVWWPSWLDPNALYAAFGPRGDEGGGFRRQESFLTPWGNVATLMSNPSGDPDVYYKITIEEDETLS